MITLEQIQKYLKELLDPTSISDYGINGIQVENNNSVTKIAFAVDASLESIKSAVDHKCDLLIVHHGIFWGRPSPITGILKKRIQMMLENNLALIAYHLPLDCHSELGNNIQILKHINAGESTPFGKDKGIYLGHQMELETPRMIEDICKSLSVSLSDKNITYLNFGTQNIQKIAVVSGAGPRFLQEAIDSNCDLFITGDHDHVSYHQAKENNINVLFAGHYFTETFGVKALKEHLRDKFDIETIYYDIPTGL